jgi:signal transduction histidine kinase
MKFLHTIREKILLIFFICIAFIGLNATFHSWQISFLERKLEMLEHFEDLLKNVFEIRRYEKNYFHYRDARNFQYLSNYIHAAEKTLTLLTPDIKMTAERMKYSQFRETLSTYLTLIDTIAPLTAEMMEPSQQEAIRTEGKSLFKLANELYKSRRKRIDRSFKRATSIPLVIAGLFLVLFIITNSITSSILSPLRLIRRTTKKIAAGDFSPIDYSSGNNPEEISSVMKAFNRMIRELELRQDELVQSRKIAAIGTLTSGIAHELNNPLNNISITAETLLDDFHDLSDEGKVQLIKDISSQSEKASEVVKNLLDFSRYESPSFELLSIAEVIDGTLGLVKNQLSLNQISLKLEMPENLPSIQGNKRNLEQVFLNLVLNAIQAMPGGGKISVRAQSLSNGYLKIEVSDTGMGIRHEDLDHIFDPFFSTKEVGSGTGLGLSVSFGIIKKHNGRIEVESEVGKGSTFAVYLPIIRDEAMDQNGQDHHYN